MRMSSHRKIYFDAINSMLNNTLKSLVEDAGKNLDELCQASVKINSKQYKVHVKLSSEGIINAIITSSE